MKQKYSIIKLFIVAIALLVWFEIKNCGKAVHLTTADENTRVQQPTPEDQRTVPPSQDRRDDLRPLLETNDTRIEFAGKVEDENGVALGDVEVLYSVVKSGSFAPSLGLSTGMQGSVRTSRDGRFSISGQIGTSLSIDILKKVGYHEIQRMSRSFSYGDSAEPHKNNEANPTIFILTKDGGARSIRRNIPLRFDWNGESVRYGLPIPGMKEAIILTPQRDNPNQSSEKYNWSLGVQIDGGIVAMGRKGEPSIAPVQGYSERVSIRGEKSDPLWGSAADVIIYFKTKSGKYGQMRLSAYSDRSSAGRTGTCIIAINPDGGRAFE